MIRHISRHLFIITLAAMLPVFSMAQDDSSINNISNKNGQITNVSKNEKDLFTAGVNYQSKLQYYGRTDSLHSSGLLPNIGFQLKCGLYVQGNFIFIENSQLPVTYAGTTIEGGYRFPETKHFRGNISYTQVIYKDNDLPQSAIKEQTGVNATYVNSIINITGGADLKFSAKTDVGATLGFDHLFLFHHGTSKMAMAIDPSLYINSGTQNFTNVYQKSIPGLPISQDVSEDITRFNILSYEFSMPVVFVAGKFNASITPGYVIPQNLITIPGHPELSEYGQSLFYVSLGIGIRL